MQNHLVLVALFINLYETDIFKNEIIKYLKLGLMKAVSDEKCIELKIGTDKTTDKNEIMFNNKRLLSIFSLMGGLTDALVTDSKVDEFRYTVEDGLYPSSFQKVWTDDRKPAMKMPDQIVAEVVIVLENLEKFTQRQDLTEPVFQVMQKSLEFTVLTFLKFQVEKMGDSQYTGDSQKQPEFKKVIKNMCAITHVGLLSGIKLEMNHYLHIDALRTAIRHSKPNVKLIDPSSTNIANSMKFDETQGFGNRYGVIFSENMMQARVTQRSIEKNLASGGTFLYTNQAVPDYAVIFLNNFKSIFKDKKASFVVKMVF